VDTAAAARSRALLTEGARLFDEGKFHDAYVAFLAAWAIKQTPSLAKNLADCEVALGKHRDAADHLRFIVKAPNVHPDDKRRAQAMLDDALKKIGTFRIWVSIDNADVFLDGQPIGKSPIRDSIHVVPGRHTFEARHDRYEPARSDVEFTAGSSRIVRFEMIVSGTSPDAPSPTDRPRRIALRTGLGLTLGGLIFGSVAAALANKSARDAAALRMAIPGSQVPGNAPCAMPTMNNQMLCKQLYDTENTHGLRANAAVGMFIVAGAAAIGSASLWTYAIMTKDQHPIKPVIGLTVAPAFTGHEGGAVLSGHW
jgi:hypothetical protein